MEHLTIFSERLNELTKEKELTRYAVAKQIGIPYSTAQAWFVGSRYPSIEYLIQLAQFFECSVDYLLGVRDDF